MAKKYERITDAQRLMLIKLLKKVARENKANIWRYVAELLQKPRRLRPQVNISKINRYTKDGDTIVIPGKVLGAGNLDHKVTVAAYSYSESAKEKIENAGGKVISIQDLINENPKGSNVKIII
ncbi:MAG: 50S ribosomal protein L18e [Candidatus Njordarchaeota archaeon]